MCTCDVTEKNGLLLIAHTAHYWTAGSQSCKTVLCCARVRSVYARSQLGSAVAAAMLLFAKFDPTCATVFLHTVAFVAHRHLVTLFFEIRPNASGLCKQQFSCFKPFFKDLLCELIMYCHL